MSRDKLGTLYFLFRKTYYQQTWQTRVDEVSSINSNDNFLMWCSDVMWQIKNAWLLFIETYDHQTFKGRGLGWGAPGYQVIVPFDYKITWQIKNLGGVSDFYTTRP